MTIRRRAVSILEFAIVLPIFLFLVFFMVDAARLLMVNNAMQEATYRAARASAIVGTTAVAQKAFDDAVAEIPGASAVTEGSARLTTNGVCPLVAPLTGGGLAPVTAEQYVSVQSTYSVTVLTPGLGVLLSFVGGDGIALTSDFPMRSTAVSRCEVAGPQGGG
jgi:Flp pilus assembly protein TadG